MGACALLSRSLEGPFLPVDHVGFPPSPTLYCFTIRSTTPCSQAAYSIAEHCTSIVTPRATPSYGTSGDGEGWYAGSPMQYSEPSREPT